MKQLNVKMPTLEEAKVLCKNFDRVINGHVLLLAPIAPIIASNGVFIGDDSQKAAQKDINRKGMLVVACGNATPNTAPVKGDNNIYEGERVLFNPESMAAFLTTIHTEEQIEGIELPDTIDLNANHSVKLKEAMTKAYTLICMHSSNIAVTLKQ